jgi:hypothetical protein
MHPKSASRRSIWQTLARTSPLVCATCSLLLAVPAAAQRPEEGTDVGCDYWERSELSDLEQRLDGARAAYRSIADPTRAELEAEHRRMWNYWKEQGYDPRRQMGDEAWLRRVFKGRVYKERVGFRPTQEEFWIFCIDTRQRTRQCQDLLRQSGNLEFDASGTALAPPPAFVDLYESRRDDFFEHVMLGAMIVGALHSCIESPEAEALADKAYGYLREFQAGR